MIRSKSTSGNATTRSMTQRRTVHHEPLKRSYHGVTEQMFGAK